MRKVICVKEGKGLVVGESYLLISKFFDSTYGEIYHVKLGDKRSGQYPADCFSEVGK